MRTDSFMGEWDKSGLLGGQDCGMGVCSRGWGGGGGIRGGGVGGGLQGVEDGGSGES